MLSETLLELDLRTLAPPPLLAERLLSALRGDFRLSRLSPLLL